MTEVAAMNTHAFKRLLESAAETFTEDQIIGLLWARIRDPRKPKDYAIYGSQSELAEAIGVSAAHLNGVLRGKKRPGTHVLDYLGMERTVVYRRAISAGDSR